MPSYNIDVLGQSVSFKTDADQERIDRARRLLEDRYRQLEPNGRTISKEKLLIYVALRLADDVLESNQEMQQLQGRLGRLLSKIDEGAGAGARDSGPPRQDRDSGETPDSGSESSKGDPEGRDA